MLCRVSGFLLRLMGRGGTNLPGKIALKICPGVLARLSQGVTVVVVTGTNGKTTTSRMLEECFRRAGLNYFANRSGANLLSGVVAEFARNSSLLGKNRCDYALIECDEAAFRHVSRFVDAKCIVVTNVFRDQLDRYGEVSHTLAAIGDAVENSPNAAVCLNADCSLTSTLGDKAARAVWFGVNTPIYEDAVRELSDALYCARCKSPYEYSYVTYGHLGGFSCPNCGYARQEPDAAVSRVLDTGSDSSTIELVIGGAPYTATVCLPGGYNIYNAAAAACAAFTLGIAPELIVEALGGFECGFGRAEKIDAYGAELRMMLVKNPAGCNQVLNYLKSAPEGAQLAFLLNDRIADGTDISWIWDVDFESLAAVRDRFDGVYVSGVRADDMALRLKYAGIDEQDIVIIRDYDELIRAVTEPKTPVYMLPTYTAMLDIRQKLRAVADMKDFWE